MGRVFVLPLRAKVSNTPLSFSVNQEVGFSLDKITKAYGI
jgi:hypothetical protein